MNVEKMLGMLGSEFYTGVPDSQLKPLCNYLMSRYGVGKQHIIAANEGNAVGLAAGYFLATGKVPVVYLQNSGIGNIINPVASLMNDEVYAIPCVFFVGWRGEPGIHDEPQHIYQGKVTIKLLEDMDIRTFVIRKETTEQELQNQINEFLPLLKAGKQVAFIVGKGALDSDAKIDYSNDFRMSREDAVRAIARFAEDDVIISTTGKASRELFEVRTADGTSHDSDFLTVGSMGHSSSIALSVAMNRPERRVWCIDGDGAALMHMGAMPVIGANHPQNLIHIIINNESYETVGGMPTVAATVDFMKTAEACGYQMVLQADDPLTLQEVLKRAGSAGVLTLIEVKCSIGARSDLGRPTTTARQNRDGFMHNLLGHRD